MKMGKRKREKVSRLAGPGVFLAQPGASARATAWAGSPLGPPAGDTAWGRRRGTGPHAGERGADGV
jgi:hypothetical protein